MRRRSTQEVDVSTRRPDPRTLVALERDVRTGRLKAFDRSDKQRTRATQQRSSVLRWAVPVGVAALVGIVIAVAVFAAGDDDTADEPQPTPVPTTATSIPQATTSATTQPTSALDDPFTAFEGTYTISIVEAQLAQTTGNFVGASLTINGLSYSVDNGLTHASGPLLLDEPDTIDISCSSTGCGLLDLDGLTLIGDQIVVANQATGEPIAESTFACLGGSTPPGTGSVVVIGESGAGAARQVTSFSYGDFNGGSIGGSSGDCENSYIIAFDVVFSRISP